MHFVKFGRGYKSERELAKREKENTFRSAKCMNALAGNQHRCEQCSSAVYIINKRMKRFKRSVDNGTIINRSATSATSAIKDVSISELHDKLKNLDTEFMTIPGFPDMTSDQRLFRIQLFDLLKQALSEPPGDQEQFLFRFIYMSNFSILIRAHAFIIGTLTCSHFGKGLKILVVIEHYNI